MIARRPIGRYDNVLVGPSPDAEVLTDRVPRMIPMIRSSPGGKGWELVFPAGLAGHVTAAGRTRALDECASDAAARTDGDLAVFPLPEGAVGGIELGALRVRFREVAEGDVVVVEPSPADETEPTSIGIGVVALLLVLAAVLAVPRAARVVADDGIDLAAASPASPTPTAIAAVTGEATPESSATAGADGATPAAATPTAIAETGAPPAPTPDAAATPREHDPLELAVGSPRNAGARPTRTPPPSGFLAEAPELDDDAFEERLVAVPTMTPPPSGLALTGPEGELGGSIGPSGAGTAGRAVRDGGKGVVGPVEVGPASTGNVKVASAGKVETPVEGHILSQAPRVSGTIDSDGVAAVVQEASAGFRQCYESALRRNTRLSGQVVLTWRIVADGAAEEIATGASTLRDEQIERCLMTRVRLLRFPRPDGGAVNVEFPMVFRAAAEL